MMTTTTTTTILLCTTHSSYFFWCYSVCTSEEYDFVFSVPSLI